VMRIAAAIAKTTPIVRLRMLSLRRRILKGLARRCPSRAPNCFFSLSFSLE
jgi:hypothetical protein